MVSVYKTNVYSSHNITHIRIQAPKFKTFDSVMGT